MTQNNTFCKINDVKKLITDVDAKSKKENKQQLLNLIQSSLTQFLIEHELLNTKSHNLIDEWLSTKVNDLKTDFDNIENMKHELRLYFNHLMDYIYSLNYIANQNNLSKHRETTTSQYEELLLTLNTTIHDIVISNTDSWEEFDDGLLTNDNFLFERIMLKNKNNAKGYSVELINDELMEQINKRINILNKDKIYKYYTSFNFLLQQVHAYLINIQNFVNEYHKELLECFSGSKNKASYTI